MPAALTRIELPRRPRRYGFALTPLADAMFQLLVFFMLSSNLAPYALLPLRSGAIGGTGASAGNGDAEGPALAAGQTAIWSVSRDSLVAGGQRFGFDRLPDLAVALQQAGTAQVLLVTRPDAQVQGIVTVLETLATHGIVDVQVARGGGGP